MQSTAIVSAGLEQKESKNSPTLTKFEDAYGECFIPLPDNKTVAFIQQFDTSPQKIILWNPATNAVTELNHKRSPEDLSRIDGLAVSEDGRFLIASVMPSDSSFRKSCLGFGREGHGHELLVWDLQSKIIDPLCRVDTKVAASIYRYKSAVITKNNTLMVYYYNFLRGQYLSRVATFAMGQNGALQALDVLSLNDKKGEALVMNSQGFIFEVAESNQLNIRNSKGEVLQTYYFRSKKGVLEIGQAPFTAKSDEWLYKLCLIDNVTLALAECNKTAVYLLDITNVNELKLRGYVDNSLLELRYYQTPNLISLHFEMGLLAVEHAGEVIFFDCEARQVAARYQLEEQSTCFRAAFLNDDSFVYSANVYPSDRKNILVRTFDLLEAVKEDKVAKKVLQSESIGLPRPVTNIIGGYLTGRGRFFSSSAEILDLAPMELGNDEGAEHKDDVSRKAKGRRT